MTESETLQVGLVGFDAELKVIPAPPSVVSVDLNMLSPPVRRMVSKAIGIAPSEPAEPTALETVNSKLGDTISAIAAIQGSIRRLNERAFGPAGEPSAQLPENIQPSQAPGLVTQTLENVELADKLTLILAADLLALAKVI
jgi:hypothetical protein